MADLPINTDSEEWRDVPGWEGFYEVSSHGRVKRLPRIVRGRGGALIPRPGCIRKTPTANKLGHKNVMLCAGTRIRTVQVQVLVCEAFHGPKPSAGHQAAHGDGNPANNHYRNLRWATPKENGEDKVLHGRSLKGLANHNAKLTDEIVRTVRVRSRSGESAASISKDYGVSSVCINNVLNNRTWVHVE